MSGVIIELLEENTIGRNFQIAAIGSILKNLPPGLRGAVMTGLSSGVITLSPSDFDNSMNILVDFLEKRVCEIKDPARLAPKLYVAGIHDSKILSSIGLQGLTCKDLVDYYRNGILASKINTTASIPMSLRTYIYSRFRDFSSIKNITVQSLYLALAGALISIIGIVRSEGARRRFELYLIPDGSLGSLGGSSVIYELLHVPEAPYHHYLQVFSDLDGVSLEIASLLSYLTHAHAAAQAKRILLRNLTGSFEKFRLVNIEATQRPLVIWERALAISHYILKLGSVMALDLLDTLYLLAMNRDLRDTISQCINDIYQFLETGIPDPLVRCSSSMARMVDKLSVEDRRRLGDLMALIGRLV